MTICPYAQTDSLITPAVLRRRLFYRVYSNRIYMVTQIGRFGKKSFIPMSSISRPPSRYRPERVSLSPRQVEHPVVIVRSVEAAIRATHHGVRRAELSVTRVKPGDRVASGCR